MTTRYSVNDVRKMAVDVQSMDQRTRITAEVALGRLRKSPLQLVAALVQIVNEIDQEIRPICAVVC
jgi:hypothetical protein